MQRYPAVMLGVFGVTLFVSATLLFLVQPMIGKMITPLLGGTPAVWNTCMVFFQAVLLAGYAYAHGTTAWLGVRRQALLHLGILVLPFLFFPLTVNAELIRGTDAYPVPSLLLLLFLSVGVPFFVVSTSAPLLQKWFASTPHPAARDPYFLYGSSNLGSMLALVGYPFAYEYFVPLSGQRTIWIAGYVVLVLLVGTCAAALGLSPIPTKGEEPKTDSDGKRPPDPWQATAGPEQNGSRQRTRGRRKAGRAEAGNATNGTKSGQPVAAPVLQEITWARRLRWVLLAAVPSSLMLGVTTYMTTDIAAIPLLWLPPLALYLLTFIIVFARVPPLVHRIMVLLLPLLVLLLAFLMLSEFRPTGIAYTIALHLITMFVVAMVCHGELARDRPAPRSLTEFFLWMSVGGVAGGLFNGLLAPVLFIGNVEYALALVAGCWLMPSLGWDRDYGKWGNYADIGMAGFCGVVGLTLITLRLYDNDLFLNRNLARSAAPWIGVAFVLAIGLAVFNLLKAPVRRPTYAFDLVLPFALLLLVVGLVWGLQAETVKGPFVRLARFIEIEPTKVRQILTFGVPAVLCYTFVERSPRFGLGVGALMLAGAICGLASSPLLYDTDTIPLYQTRSFFGVLRVDYDKRFICLVHGTTLHGKQYRPDLPENELLIDEPLTYYARSGPVGHLFDAYNVPNAAGVRPNLGVIGLGTGTMACYAEKGQHLTFFEIDPAVRDISFTDNGYFSFVRDARARGVVVEDLVLGDARLTMQRRQLAATDKYGILIVDAFSSDAIPIHLITQNALRIFFDKVVDDGVIAFHISNRHINLLPVLANIAEAEDVVGLYEQDLEDAAIGKASTTWVVLARKAEHLERLPNDVSWDKQVGVADWPKVQAVLRSACVPGCEVEPQWRDLRSQRAPRAGVWTDDYSNLLSVFRW